MGLYRVDGMGELGIMMRRIRKVGEFDDEMGVVWRCVLWGDGIKSV